MSDRMTFVEACALSLEALAAADDWVDRWHDSGGVPGGHALSLAEYLGLTDGQYSVWVIEPKSMGDVVAGRRHELATKYNVVRSWRVARTRLTDGDTTRTDSLAH